jgi:DNA polymerase-3 subunit alpha
MTKEGKVSLKASDYVHLHNHTQFSLLDGLTKIPKLIDFVKADGMQAVAMTDHGTLSGTVEFYKTAKKEGIKPLIGIETYVANRKHTDKDPQKDKQRFHLIIIAMNKIGYENLMRLSTIANLDGFYYFPRIDHELLEQYNEGLIILSACMGGEIGQALKNQQTKQAEEIAGRYKSVFGDRYYLEIQDHGHPDNPMHNPEQQTINEAVLALGKKLDIPVVVTCDAHYLNHEDQEAHEALLCVGTGSFLSDEKRMSLKEFPLHVEDSANIISRWGSVYPEVITNTKAIADRCDVELSLGGILIPKFPVPDTDDEKSYLHKLVYRGLSWRYGGVEEARSQRITMEDAKKTLPPEVLERTEFELGVIDRMGFNGYFLIVQDFINWGKSEGIIFGPGRGSAAGSIVAYATRITELDPIKYDLLFERFLNPDRISMPDIDIDIQDTRRGEVIEYCANKYGRDQVANIVTFGTMAARAAVRDVARVMEVPYAEADRIAKLIPPPVQGRHIPLATSIKEDVDLKNEYENNPTAKTVIDLAIRLEGTVRSHGVHAAGVVIAPDEIVKYVPLEMAQKGVVATQYPMGPVEDLGLLKMDFLGLSNLTIIRNAQRIIKRVYNTAIDLQDIPLDDQKTFELFQRGDTTGVFQLESAGMKRYLKELKPSVFDDIIAMVALYRPGPMQFIDSFIKRKHGEEEITYLHPKMEGALSSTYGILVYQEQFMQISKDLAGFTGGQADTLRKAVGKKIMEMMRKVKPEFIEGAIEHSGADRALMEKFWAQLEEFANYCFNKSHAACYGLIAYWTAYLKAHYPDAFMAALMTSDADDIDRLAIEIGECRHVGIEVLPPDINESYPEFAVVPGKNQIRFGMNAIKNVGSGAVEDILRAREEGHFNTLEDIFTRINPRVVNRKALESLVKAGALDGFSDRSTLLENMDSLLAFASRIQKERMAGQVGLFADEMVEEMTPKIYLENATITYNKQEQLKWERDLLGLYLSEHPLKTFETYLAELTMPISTLKPEMDGKAVVVGGAIVDKREITTKKGQKMAFVRIADLQSELEVILFPSVYQQTIGIWERDKVVMIKGKINSKDRDTGEIGQEIKILADEAREITVEQAEAYQPRGKSVKVPSVRKSKNTKSTETIKNNKIEERLYLRLRDSSNQTQLTKLKNIIDKNQGKTDVVLVIGNSTDKQIIKLPTGIAMNLDVVKELRELVGSENIVTQ